MVSVCGGQIDRNTVSFMALAEFPTLRTGSIETREHQLAPSYSAILKQKALKNHCETAHWVFWLWKYQTKAFITSILGI